MPRCPNCGGEYQPGARFCPRCMRPLAAASGYRPAARARRLRRFGHARLALLIIVGLGALAALIALGTPRLAAMSARLANGQGVFAAATASPSPSAAPVPIAVPSPSLSPTPGVSDKAKADAASLVADAAAARQQGNLDLALSLARQALVAWPDDPAARQLLASLAPEATAAAETAVPQATALAARQTPVPRSRTPGASPALTAGLSVRVQPATVRVGQPVVVQLVITNMSASDLSGVRVVTTGPWDKVANVDVAPNGTFARTMTGYVAQTALLIPPGATRSVLLRVEPAVAGVQRFTFALRELDGDAVLQADGTPAQASGTVTVSG